MPINDIHFYSCTFKDAEFKEFKEFKTNEDFQDVQISTKAEGWDKLSFLITITITATTTRFNIIGGIVVYNKFIVETSDNTIKLITDADFKKAADIIQIALAQARYVFNEQCKHTVLKEEYLRIETTQSIFENVKNNVYSMWN